MAVLSNATPTYVLQRSAYTDRQDILRTFTLADGRIDVVMRGKKSKAELFTPYIMQYSGQSALKTARYVDQAQQSYALYQQAMFCGLYVNELLFYILPLQEPFPIIFARYSDVMAHLQQGFNATHTALLLRLFEGVCIESLGLHPNLQIDDQGRSIDADQSYFINAQSCFEQSNSNIKSIHPVFKGSSLQHITDKLHRFKHGEVALSLEDNHINHTKAMRQIYQPILAQLLHNKTLVSRKLWQQS